MQEGHAAGTTGRLRVRLDFLADGTDRYTPVALLVVGGRRRSGVDPRCCDFLPPVRARHHLPDLAVSELRMGLGGVPLDGLEQVFVIRAGELDPIVARIYTVESAHGSSFRPLTDRCDYPHPWA